MRHCLQFNNLKSLVNKGIFTSIDAKKYGVNSALLNYYIKTGVLERVRRGVYRQTSKCSNKSLRWQDLIDAVRSIPSSSICLSSALAVYGLSEEMPRQHWIGIPHSTSSKTPREIKTVRFRNPDLGLTKIKLDGVDVPIYDVERTIVDAFRLLSIETAIKALKFAIENKGINLVRFRSHAKQLRINVEPYLLSMIT